jgi:hypothetical protein
MANHSANDLPPVPPPAPWPIADAEAAPAPSQQSTHPHYGRDQTLGPELTNQTLAGSVVFLDIVDCQWVISTRERSAGPVAL